MNNDLRFDLIDFIDEHNEFEPPYGGDYSRYVVDLKKYKLFLKLLVNWDLHNVIGTTQEERITNVLKDNFMCAVVGEFISFPEGEISPSHFEMMLDEYYKPLLKRGIETKSLKYVHHIIKHINEESMRLRMLSKGQFEKNMIRCHLMRIMGEFEITLIARLGLERLCNNIADNLYLFETVDRKVLEENKIELIQKYGLDGLSYEGNEDSIITQMQTMYNINEQFEPKRIASSILNILLH